MAYNFGADTGLLEELAASVDGYRDSIQADITQIYSTIAAMQTNWNGESYGTFFNECYSYASSLQALVVLLAGFSKVIREQTVAAATDLESETAAAFAKLG